MNTKKILLYFAIAVLPFLLSGCYGDNNDFAGADFGGVSGQGGSWARFTIEGNYLYTVSEMDVNTFDISDPQNPTLVNTIFGASQNLETIFSTDTVLFLGSKEGMVIYSLRNPAAPSLLSSYQHRDALVCPVTRQAPANGPFLVCDPIVSDGKFGYLTLKAEAPCRDPNTNAVNPTDADQMIVFDLANLRNPIPIGNYDMESPEGLGIWNDLLFVADEGLKVFDRTDSYNLEQIGFYDIPAYDVIALRNSLLITADDGFHQYDIVDRELEYVSSILVGE
ncbi:MAG: hypothetical protein AAF740_08465 [Bacteroidota bacterium]